MTLFPSPTIARTLAERGDPELMFSAEILVRP